jgi:glycosyltransferase involved in cell wall biosynthesis
VVATNCGGPRDYITGADIGELVDNSTEGIAAGLRNMAARLPCIDRAKIRRQAVTNFDFGLLARRLGELYSDLVKRRAAGHR